MNKRWLTNHDYERIGLLLLAGFSARQVAQHTGRSLSTVWMVRRTGKDRDLLRLRDEAFVRDEA